MGRPIKAVFALLLAISCSSVAYSCSCDGISQRKAFRKASAIFVGEVIEYIDTPIRPDAHYVVKFKVGKYWKGGDSPEIIVQSWGMAGICGGFNFLPGNKYLVYAYGKQLLARTVCDRSIPLEYASDDIERLNSFWFRLGGRLWVFN